MTAQRTLRPHSVAAVALGGVLLFGFTPRALAATGQAATAISVQASASGYPAGAPVFAAATLGQGDSPTGAVTFSLYGPADASCSAAPLFVTQAVVNGNGYYQSASYVTNAAGTYRWTARYGGDSRNSAVATACADAAAAVTLARRTPTLSSNASGPAATVTNTATVGSASGPNGPAGSITFSLYGAGNMTCAGAPVFTSVKAVSGMGTYTSDAYQPIAAGTYQWTVVYSGDANNNAAAATCSDPANDVTVSGSTAGPGTGTGGTGTGGPTGPSGPTVTAPASVKPAEYLTVTWSGVAAPTSTDWFALFAVGAPDSAVVAWKYSSGTANGSSAMKVPWGTKAGNYEVRLFSNNTTQRLGVSSVVTVWQ